MVGQTLPDGDEGLLTTNAAGVLVTRRVRVRVTDGPDRGLGALIARGTLIVGSGVGADLTLTDPRVSRRHVELGILPNGVRVRDLGSRNGTWAGPARLESAVVEIGTELTVGQSRLLLLSEDAPVETGPERTRFGPLVGRDLSMRRAFDVLAVAALRDCPILIEGEEGTGKTEAANAVHEASARRERPLIPLAISTGPAEPAVTEAFDAAGGGTLILDRLDLAGAATARVLHRLLSDVEEGRRDVRPIATSRSDLRERVRAGGLPRDLYFQIAVVRVALPPLRARLDDVPLILRALAHRQGIALPETTAAILADGLVDGLEGNVRALRNALERMAVTGSPALAPDRSLPEVGDYKERKQAALDAFQRSYLEALVARHGDDVAGAAREAGIDKAYLLRLLSRHGLS